MKLLMMLLCIFTASTVMAADNLGQKVEFYTNEGKPAFGVQYVYDLDFAWVSNFTLIGKDLSAGNKVYLIAWRLWNAKTKTFLTNWQVVEKNSNGVSYPGTISFSWAVKDENLVKQVVADLPNVMILISVNGDEQNLFPSHHIALGSFCASSPGNFLNLTTGSNGCSAD